MPDDQQNDRYRPLRPQLQVRILPSEGTEPITIHPATDSLINASTEAADKEKPGHPNAIDSGNKNTETSVKPTPLSSWRSENLPPTLQWIPANWSWSKWKPVLRSALAAWISLLLFLIPTTLNVMGQVGFFRSCLPSLDLRNLQAAFLIIIGKLLEDPSQRICSAD